MEEAESPSMVIFNRCGAYGHGLYLAVLGLRLDSVILKVFSNLNSVIL